MRKFLPTVLLLLSCWRAFAQTGATGPVIPSTTFTRGFMTNLNLSSAQTYLGITGGGGGGPGGGVGFASFDTSQFATNAGGIVSIKSAASVTNATNFGTIFAWTNSANPSNTVLWLPDYAHLVVGTAGLGLNGSFDMYNNPAHGPGAEIQMTAQRRMSILFGYANQHNDALQIGSGNQLAGAGQGTAANVYFNGDFWPVGSGNALGYSLLVDWHIPVWLSGALTGYNPIGMRAEAMDVVGNNALRFYANITNENPLIGQVPGTAVFEIWTNGIVITGKTTRGMLAVTAGANYGVDFDNNSVAEIQMSAALTLTNVTGFFPRTNQSTTATYKLYSGLTSWALTTPGTWTWISGGGTAVAPTNVAASNVMVISVSQNIGNLTNYLAEYKFGPYTPTADADASTFFTAASVTDGTTKFAINQYVLGLKASNIWTKLVSVWPMVGGVSGSCIIDLKANHNLVNHGATFSSKGIIGDGAAAYMDCNFALNNGELTSQNSTMLMVSIQSTNAASPHVGTSQFLIGSTDGHRSGLITGSSGPTAIFSSGVNSGSDNEVGPSATPAGNFLGIWVVNRTASTTEAVYQNYNNTAGSLVTAATAGFPTSNTYLLARDVGGPANFANFTLSGAAIGQNFTDADVKALTTLTQTLNTTLGR